MKIVSSLRRKGWKFWFLLVLPFSLLGGLLFFLAPNDYPTSDVVINPSTGRYDSFLDSWVSPITSPSPSGDTVVIDLGDRGGVANSIESDVLLVLSPVIRMHPRAKKFIVIWELRLGMTSDPGQELVYNRDSGQVFNHRKWWFQEKLYDKNDLIAAQVKDRQIHKLAARRRGFSELGKK